MRECYNEEPVVFEAVGDDLAGLLRDATETLEQLEDYSTVSINVHPGLDTVWLVVMVVF